MKQGRQNIYDDIIREAEIRKQQQLVIIEKKFCPNCRNRREGCLKLEYAINYGAEVYNCVNYKN